jgi:diaminopimelate epimerase
MRFIKYQALGNDYLVIPPEQSGLAALDAAQITAICDRHFGIGADGILWGPLPTTSGRWRLRIFNPDGSEAEKSGNGVRIFCRYLWDQGLVQAAPFVVQTPGGLVGATVTNGGRSVVLQMGTVSFWSDQIPVTGPRREVLKETLRADDREFTFCAATVGNPHCVLPLASVDAATARRYGPHIERHPIFPSRTNVQFLQVLDRTNIRLEIWERGAGYTLASGTSASAAAGVARRLDLIDAQVQVHMPGGALAVQLDDQLQVQIAGPVTRVATGDLDPELFGCASC